MKLEDLKAGDTITLDAGFTCALPRSVIVEKDMGGKFFKCDDGKHYLDGQEDETGHLVGVS